MNTQTENLKALSVEDLLRPFEATQNKNLQSLFSENMQLRDQVAMLEAEVDKQDKIIKLFAELLFLTCGDK
jgi:phage portal protein BeeE